MLKGSDRKHLRGLAHHLKPVVQVGRQGLIENLITTVSQALDAHELIKVKFVDFRQQKEELSLEIATRTKSELAGLVGNIAILYRPALRRGEEKDSFAATRPLRGPSHESDRSVCAFLACDVRQRPKCRPVRGRGRAIAESAGSRLALRLAGMTIRGSYCRMRHSRGRTSLGGCHPSGY